MVGSAIRQRFLLFKVYRLQITLQATELRDGKSSQYSVFVDFAGRIHVAPLPSPSGIWMRKCTHHLRRTNVRMEIKSIVRCQTYSKRILTARRAMSRFSKPSKTVF